MPYISKNYKHEVATVYISQPDQNLVCLFFLKYSIPKPFHFELVFFKCLAVILRLLISARLILCLSVSASNPQFDPLDKAWTRKQGELSPSRPLHCSWLSSSAWHLWNPCAWWLYAHQGCFSDQTRCCRWCSVPLWFSGVQFSHGCQLEQGCRTWGGRNHNGAFFSLPRVCYVVQCAWLAWLWQV